MMMIILILGHYHQHINHISYGTLLMHNFIEMLLPVMLIVATGG